MITSDTLILKLKLQSRLLAKSLNLPESFGNDLLATAIYQHFDFNELCESVSEFEYALSFESLSEYQKLKYLFICEIEDKELIDDLHKEIENMAIRLEERTVINISKLDLISNLYKLFGLDNESRYIIDADDIKLIWHPCFESLKDPQAVLMSDLLINEIPFRMIATKVQFDEFSVDNVKNSLHRNLAQAGESSVKTNEERIKIDGHIKWLADSCDCLSNIESDTPDRFPEFYKINNQNFFIYGFILAPHKQSLTQQQSGNIKIHVKNTSEKQVFILRFGGGKLALEFIYIHKTEDGEKPYTPKNQYIQDTLLSHPNACSFPAIFNNAYYLMPIRPFAHIDWLKNAL